MDPGTRVMFALMRVLGIGLSIRLLELGENDAVAFYSSLLESAEVSEGALRGFLEHVRVADLDMNDGLVEVLSVSRGWPGHTRSLGMSPLAA